MIKTNLLVAATVHPNSTRTQVFSWRFSQTAVLGTQSARTVCFYVPAVCHRWTCKPAFRPCNRSAVMIWSSWHKLSNVYINPQLNCLLDPSPSAKPLVCNNSTNVPFCTRAGNHITLRTGTNANQRCPTSFGISIGPGDLAKPNSPLQIATQNFYSQPPAVSNPHTLTFLQNSTYPPPVVKKIKK